MSALTRIVAAPAYRRLTTAPDAPGYHVRNAAVGPWKMTVLIALLYTLTFLGLFIAVAVYWVSRRKEIRECSRFALAVAGVYAVVVIPLMLGEQEISWLLAFMLTIDILKLFLFTAVGVWCCVAAGIVAFPLLRPGLGTQQATARRSAVAPVSIGLVFAGVWIAFTTLLFHLSDPQLTDAAKRVFGPSGESDNLAIAMLAMATCALGEELIFRLGIQNYIARIFGLWDGRYWLAILLSSVLWTVGHLGMLEPGWVKLAQVFPAALALGWLARKHGIETCIVAHVVFNVAVCWMADAGLLL